jgi:hypothetical protein
MLAAVTQEAIEAGGRAELETNDGAAAEGVAELLEGLGTRGVLATLDTGDRRGRRTHARR